MSVVAKRAQLEMEEKSRRAAWYMPASKTCSPAVSWSATLVMARKSSMSCSRSVLAYETASCVSICGSRSVLRAICRYRTRSSSLPARLAVSITSA